MRIGKILIIAAVISFVTSCASYYETIMKSTDVDLKYEAAFNYYNQGKYRRSAEIFESLILLMQGLPQEDTVQYYTALSNYKMRDYVTAESNFDKFVQVFPRSPFTEDAKFLRIKCLYESTYRYELDQTPTRKAMSVIGEFMYENPASQHYDECNAMIAEFKERLDKKSFESAKLYYTIEDYQAAHYALKNVLKENADNVYRENVLYYTALASYKYALHSIPEKQKERYLTFIDDYYNFIGEYSKSAKRKELDVYYKKALIYTKKSDAKEGMKSEVLSKSQQRELMKQSREAIKEVKKAEKMKRQAEKAAENASEEEIN